MGSGPREQGDRLRLVAPVAHDPAGKTIRGLVRSDFTPAQKLEDMPLGHFLLGPTGGKGYPVDDPNSVNNILTVRETPEGQRQTIARNRWSFAHTVDDHLVTDPHYIRLEGGFQPGKIYEVVYEAKDPAVAGLGLASVRDFLSYLKYDPKSTAPVHRVYAVGISQSGRFLRHFLYQDFNADEQGRQVMDGVIAHVAGAGRGSFNHRFAQPSRDAQPLSSIFFPTDLFPFTDLPETDPESGETAGLFDAPNKSHNTPKIFFTNTSYEYWGRSASLIHTSPDGLHDANSGEMFASHACRLAACFRAVSSAKKQSRFTGFQRTAALQPKSRPVVLARADHGHGPVGERRHAASAEHVSQNRRCHARPIEQMELPENSRRQQTS